MYVYIIKKSKMKNVNLTDGTKLIVSNCAILTTKALTFAELQEDLNTYIKVQYLPQVIYLNGIYVYEGEEVNVNILSVNYRNIERVCIQTPRHIIDSQNWLIVRNGDLPIYVTDCNSMYRLKPNESMIFPPKTDIQVIGLTHEFNFVKIYACH